MTDPNSSNIQEDENASGGGSNVQEDENASGGGSNIQQDENASISGSNVQQDENASISGSNVQQDENASISGSNVQQDENASISGSNVQQDENAIISGSNVQQDENASISGSNVQQDGNEVVLPEGEPYTDGISSSDEIELISQGDILSETINDMLQDVFDTVLPSEEETFLLGIKDAGELSKAAANVLSEAEVLLQQDAKADVLYPPEATDEFLEKDVLLSDAESPEELDDDIKLDDEKQKLAKDGEAEVDTNGREGESKDEEREAANKPQPCPDLKSDVTVNVSLLPLNEVITLSCSFEQTIGKLKERFWKRMRIEPIVLKLKFNGEVLSNTTMLSDLGVGPNGTISLELESRDPEHFPLQSYKRVSYIPGLISVNINKKEHGQIVNVEVQHPIRNKPFLGGFRHKISRVEFYNASSQTKPLPLRFPEKTLFTRDTQTRQLSNQIVQTAQDSSTQMTKIGCYVSVAGNKLHNPGKYKTAKEKNDVILEKVIILQKYLRRHLAWKRVMRIRKQKEERLEFEKEEALKRKLEKENRIKAEFQRRQCPRSRKDFNTLYDALEKWRLHEIAKINETLTGAERKAALYMLLNQEMEHLAAIGRHQAIADESIVEKKIQNFLNKTAAPRSIISNYDHQKTLIDTPYTIRARELQEIYNSLIINNFTLDERLDILLTLKYTVREHECKLCYEITRLVDREADLLMRDISNNSLAGLRKRIATLFLQYIQTPVFNPEAARFAKLPPLSLSNKVYYCASCSKFYSSNQFPLNVNAQLPGPCKMCKSKDNEGRLRADFNIYRYMLKSLRSREERFKDNSTIAFLIQDSDILYLVEKIWNSESIISNCKDLYDLIWVRWNKEEVWSPWNCLLVTIEEAECHSQLENLKIAYGEVFVNRVLQKHLLAKSHFSRLPWLEKQINQPYLRHSFSQKHGGRYLSKQTSCNLFPSG